LLTSSFVYKIRRKNAFSNYISEKTGDNSENAVDIAHFCFETLILFHFSFGNVKSIVYFYTENIKNLIV